MRLALRLAALGQYTVAPNPMVGCVIVKDNQIISTGFHQRAGEPHAEILALNKLKIRYKNNYQNIIKNATIYINLEPCCHYGKTPPCVDELVKLKIQKIYIATIDPNPKVSGRSIEKLKANNIEVNLGLCKQEAELLNEIFFHYMIYKKPFVISKWAMSLDGKIMTHKQDDRAISGLLAQQQTMKIRQQVDAILIGSHTASQDNPQLTVRNVDVNIKNIKQPFRIILSRSGNLNLNLQLFRDNYSHKTILVTTEQLKSSTRKQFEKNNIKLIFCKLNHHDGLIDLEDLLLKLGELSIMSILVEGGETIHHSFLENKLINRLIIYLSPVIIANYSKKQRLTFLNNMIKSEWLEHDLYFTARLR